MFQRRHIPAYFQSSALRQFKGSFPKSSGLVCSFCPATSTKVELAATSCLNSIPTKDAVLPKTENFMVRHSDSQQ